VLNYKYQLVRTTAQARGPVGINASDPLELESATGIGEERLSQGAATSMALVISGSP
jgi:hypothetical protein